MRKQAFCICEKKAQISCTVTGQLISTFVFDTEIVRSHILNPKFQACSCLTLFVSGNPEDRFSCDTARICKCINTANLEHVHTKPNFHHQSWNLRQ